MTELFRVRVVFNAPIDREHPFYSVSVDTLGEAQQIVDDMRPALVHAVSVQIQENAAGSWRILPATPWGQS